MWLHWEDRHEWSLHLMESSLVAMFYCLGHVHRTRVTNFLHVHIDIFLFPKNVDIILRTKT